MARTAPSARTVFATVDPRLVDDARRKSGRTDAPVAELVRLGLCLLAGRDPETAHRPMGRPRRNPPGN